MGKRRAAVYTRISRDRTGLKAGVKRQEQDCRELVAARGWELAGVFSDNDTSAYSGRPRPGYVRMLEAIKSGEADAIIAWHPDRLHRSPRDLEDFVDLVEETRAEVVTVQAGEVDLSTAAGRMSARVVGAVARHESEHRSERVRRAMLQRARDGKHNGGGKRPYGFEDDRVTVRREEAKMIREASRRVLAGESLRSIIYDWHRREIPSPAGKDWDETTLKRTLTRARTAGLREHRGAIVGDASWKPIIDRPTLERLRSVLGARGPRRLPARAYILAGGGGLAYCGRCGEPLVSHRRQDGKRSYACIRRGPASRACGKLARLADPLEALVVDMVFDVLDSPQMKRAVGEAESSNEDDSVPIDAIRADEAALEELSRDYYADKMLTRAEYLAARDAVQERLQDRRAALAAMHTPAREVPSADRVRNAWPSMNVEQRRELLGAVIDRVVVDPAMRGRNTFDPTLVNVVWRV